jgi:hypothetical protein
VLPASTYMAAAVARLERPAHLAQNTLLYHDAMRATMGARTVDRFARLYLFPGMAHCGGGAGHNTFDVLTPVMAWVESGNQPGRIVAGNATRTPAAVRNDDNWVGQRLFSHGYQPTPRVVNGKLVL